ncbi:hypothetical protein [Neolewinella persica]|uniref:hypothetical protein n=1 Tax=Neolewinella persica TaxID=70998 RepID=UPI00037053AA|nr:hypothetical protein [Neolewinella persica]
MLIHLNLIGALLAVLSVLHAFIPGYLNWKRDLQPLSLMNRQMMQTHMIFIAITVFGIGLLCLTSAPELIGTPLGRKIALGLSVFWALRLIFQFFVYSSELWKGKKFETFIHVIAVGFWIYMMVVFGMVGLALN